MKRGRASLAPVRKRDRSIDAFLNDLVKTEEGVVSPRVFTDPEVNRLELERIFARSWLYVAHESEIPHAGDFVTRYMGEDPVVVWRGQDGRVRVFLNVCRHRGRTVCGEDMGKAAHFRCPYHGWTYNNCGELISVPFFEGYQGKLDKSSLGLYQAPKVDSYQGLIFAHWEASGESLSEYLGEIKWVLDILFGRTDGVQVLGAPMRWEAEANWKLAAANFAGDGIHVSITHGFGAALGIENEVRKSSRRLSYKLITENAHTSALQGLEDETYLALPKELWPEIESHLAKDQLEVMKHLVGTIGNVFPNLRLRRSQYDLNSSGFTSFVL